MEDPEGCSGSRWEMANSYPTKILGLFCASYNRIRRKNLTTIRKDPVRHDGVEIMGNVSFEPVQCLMPPVKFRSPVSTPVGL